MGRAGRGGEGASLPPLANHVTNAGPPVWVTHHFRSPDPPSPPPSPPPPPPPAGAPAATNALQHCWNKCTFTSVSSTTYVERTQWLLVLCSFLIELQVAQACVRGAQSSCGARTISLQRNKVARRKLVRRLSLTPWDTSHAHVRMCPVARLPMPTNPSPLNNVICCLTLGSHAAVTGDSALRSRLRFMEIRCDGAQGEDALTLP